MPYRMPVVIKELNSEHIAPFLPKAKNSSN